MLDGVKVPFKLTAKKWSKEMARDKPFLDILGVRMPY
jgi:hypothetical protein